MEVLEIENPIEWPVRPPTSEQGSLLMCFSSIASGDELLFLLCLFQILSRWKHSRFVSKWTYLKELSRSIRVFKLQTPLSFFSQNYTNSEFAA